MGKSGQENHNFMSKLIRNKILNLLGVIIGTTFLVFIIIKIAPGDPYLDWSEENKNAFGVYDPLIFQYLKWVGNLVLFDLGTSINTGKAVGGEVISKYLLTLFIVTGSLVFSLLISIPLGYFSVFKKELKSVQLLKRIIEFISTIPAFILGFFIYFLILSNFKIDIIAKNELDFIKSIMYYFIIFFILGIGNGTIIEFIEHIQNEFFEIKNKMYMQAAKSRAVSYTKHLIRSSIIPILTILSNRFVYLLSGAVIIEYLFTIQGIGLLSRNAAMDRDYPLILGITFFTILLVMLVKIFVELLTKKIYPKY